MRNLIFFMHTSLDGFASGLNGEMDWLTINDEIFEFVATFINKADTALYGRVTYELMESYWPTAADKPSASKHDKEHAIWYKNVAKVVLSKTMNGEGINNLTVISDKIPENINKIKNLPGKDILVFGSPAATHSLLDYNLIDEFWLIVNPILIGEGKPLFKNIHDKIKLKLVESKNFECGVVALHYKKV